MKSILIRTSEDFNKIDEDTEELEFVETHTNVSNYKRFCEAIFNHISDRQYFDVRDEMLTEQQLQDIYNNCFKK
jgi:hypothetical protein